MQPGRARTSGLGVAPLLLARCVGLVAPVRPTHEVLVLSCPSAALRVHVCAVSWATWLLFTGVPARCVVLLVWCPGPLGSCSPVCPLGVLFCLCGVLGHLAPVHQCALSVCCFACAVSWATWLLFTGVSARCVALLVRCPGPLGSCALVRPRVLSSAVFWATGLLFTGVPARCVVLLVRCPGPLGSCSLVCPLDVLLCLCGVLGHLAPVHRCACWVCCFACAVSWATWLLFTGVPAGCAALLVRCPGPLGSCSPVCPLGVFFCLCGVLGHLVPVHRCAHSCVALLVRCPEQLGSCALVRPRDLSSAVFWATWLLFTGVPARCVVLLVRCPGPLGSCSQMCPLAALPVCAVSSASWVLGQLQRR